MGATPVFADIDPRTFNLSPEGIEKQITPRTRAIIPVHLFGQPADMEAFLELARAHGLRVLEDAAQAIGSEYRGRKVGSLGDAATFSFFPTKNLGAYGDGGMLVTNDPTVAETAAILNVSQKTVSGWIREETLPAIRLGPGQRLIRVRRADLEAFVQTDFGSNGGST